MKLFFQILLIIVIIVGLIMTTLANKFYPEKKYKDSAIRNKRVVRLQLIGIIFMGVSILILIII
ncbi:MAG: hypothetical protein RR334_00270 [Clostridia bacterium]